MLLISGSEAIKYWFPHYQGRESDIDVITDNNLFKKPQFDNGYLPELEILLEYNKDILYIDPDVLLTLKMSHLTHNIKWTKHVKDVIFLKKQGCKPIKPLYDVLYKLWDKYHKKKKLNFNISSTEFFNPNVKRYWDHDTVHLITAFGFPIYKKMLSNDGTVACDKNKFETLSHEEKILSVIEEVIVLTCERCELRKNCRPQFLNMLQQFVTRMVGGWYAYFIIDNIEEIIHYDQQKIQNQFNIYKDWIKTND